MPTISDLITDMNAGRVGISMIKSFVHLFTHGSGWSVHLIHLGEDFHFVVMTNYWTNVWTLWQWFIAQQIWKVSLVMYTVYQEQQDMIEFKTIDTRYTIVIYARILYLMWIVKWWLTVLTLLMPETEYSGFGVLIPCLLMPWLPSRQYITRHGISCVGQTAYIFVPELK